MLLSKKSTDELLKSKDLAKTLSPQKNSANNTEINSLLKTDDLFEKDQMEINVPEWAKKSIKADKNETRLSMSFSQEVSTPTRKCKKVETLD